MREIHKLPCRKLVNRSPQFLADFQRGIGAKISVSTVYLKRAWVDDQFSLGPMTNRFVRVAVDQAGGLGKMGE
jgi:hypothetical protein